MDGKEVDFEKSRRADLNDDVDSSIRSSYVAGTEEEAKPHSQPLVDEPSRPVAVAAAAVTGDVEKQGPVHNGATTTNHVNDLTSVPNGGLQAWLQVAGSFSLFFNTWGIVNTFGVYATYYNLDILQSSGPSNIAWIGSIQAFLLLAVGMVTGPIYDMGYFHYLVGTGSFLIVFGHMMLSLCTSYWQVLLAQAFCIGLGMGCLFIASVAILATYFTTRLALATGIAASGSSLGGVIYPIILHRLLPRIGFGWTVRTIGFIAMATLLLPIFCMKVRVLPATRRKLIDKSAFKAVPFLLFCVGCCVSFAGLYTPFFFIQTFAITKRITTEDLAFYLLSILNAASVFGRIVPNLFADKIGPLNVMGPCAIMAGVLIFCLLAVHELAGIVIFALFFGFFSGSLVSLPSTVVVSLTENRRFIGTRLGMSFGFSSIGVLIGSPIGGQILKSSGFTPTWVYGGVLSTIGGVLLLMARVAHKGWQPMVKA